MCDPTMIGIASVLSTVVGTAGSLANASSQRSAQKKQQEEVRIWQQQQKKNRDAEQVRQEELRAEGDKARVAGLDELTNQGERQNEEEARLAEYLQGKSEASVANPETPLAESDANMLAGSEGGGEQFKQDLAKKISESSAGATQRIKALAKMSSFGDSFGGLGTTNPIVLANSGAGIDKANEFRRGSLGAFNVKQAVEPVQVEWTPSPMADIFSTALSVGAQGLGQLGGLGSGGGGLPITTSAIPKSRPSFLPMTTTTAIPKARVF